VPPTNCRSCFRVHELVSVYVRNVFTTCTKPRAYCSIGDCLKKKPSINKPRTSDRLEIETSVSIFTRRAYSEPHASSGTPESDTIVHDITASVSRRELLTTTACIPYDPKVTRGYTGAPPQEIFNMRVSCPCYDRSRYVVSFRFLYEY